MAYGKYKTFNACRYNISTAEYDGWDGAINSNVSQVRAQVLDGATQDGDADLRGRTISNLTDVYEQFGFTFDEATEVSRRSLGFFVEF